MTEFTVRDAVFDFCRRTGMTTVFGNPGSTELKMFRDFPSDFSYVLALQESVAVAAAAGHALGTGGAALVNLHSAGGVGHSLGAVFNAHRDRVPVVIVAGQQGRAMLPTRPFLSADEPAEFPRPYVKWSRQPARAEDVPAAFAEAYRVAMTHPRGPVFLSVPEDDWERPAEPVPDRVVHGDFQASPEALAELAEALNTARNPVIVVGPGVEDELAQPLVAELAERTGAHVWISPLSGRSGFPEDHPQFRGFLPPVRDHIVERLTGHDVIVALGAPVFVYHVHAEGPYVPADARLFHLDCDPEQTAWTPVGTSLLTTVRSGVTGLLELIDDGAAARLGRTAPEPRGLPATPRETDPMDIGLVLDTLRGALAPGTVIVEECPSHRDAFHARVPITETGGFLTTGSGALGWGLPLAVGRALTAADGQRIVCVIGDGSIMYSVQGLWTAAQHNVPLTVVVLNNNGYGAVKALGRRIGLDHMPGTDIRGIDFPAVAAGLGVPGAQVRSSADFGKALEEAAGTDGPFLIEVAVARDESPAYEPWAR
ncbi:benzoylformate decarboxylase [Actinomadura parmotrematis]|uniref:Benzoylformate decarboxylase n=1 Tax=Actinomadura parmotrematis TaxID=2864039 RepID=A0ABS7FQ19_9ACTN|nr:benzoylformate decarboxylase [Actinomadura parmotrematis]MBW8482479.1 benzoylformate decarboxylase [Actinomadura parmotrematis]